MVDGKEKITTSLQNVQMPKKHWHLLIRARRKVNASTIQCFLRHKTTHPMTMSSSIEKKAAQKFSLEKVKGGCKRFDFEALGCVSSSCISDLCYQIFIGAQIFHKRGPFALCACMSIEGSRVNKIGRAHV